VKKCRSTSDTLQTL